MSQEKEPDHISQAQFPLQDVCLNVGTCHDCSVFSAGSLEEHMFFLNIWQLAHLSNQKTIDLGYQPGENCHLLCDLTDTKANTCQDCPFLNDGSTIVLYILCNCHSIFPFFPSILSCFTSSLGIYHLILLCPIQKMYAHFSNKVKYQARKTLE